MSLLYFYNYTALEAFLIILSVLLIIDCLIAFILRKSRKWQWQLLAHTGLAVAIYALLAWAFFVHHWERNPKTFSVFFILTNHITLIYLSKIAFLIIAWLYLIFPKKFVIRMATVLGISVFILLLYGLYFGRFNFIIKENVIDIKRNLVTPIKIAFVSDLHLGQYHGHEKQFEKLIKLINSQHPDLILLGGDMLCCFSEEMKPFIPYLQRLHARYGVYAVHGNHDYGDYFWWKNLNEKRWNHVMLEYYYQLAGIKLLNNDRVKLTGVDMVVAGIENCGKPPFGCYVDWQKALEGIAPDQYTILLAHDPWNWERVVEQYPQVKITLSGHTHAYQFGIDNGHNRWSLFFPKKPWCGMYTQKDQILYISHGVGSAMFSARLGMWPEISIILLQ